MIANYDNREEIASNYSGYHCKMIKRKEISKQERVRLSREVKERFECRKE